MEPSTATHLRNLLAELEGRYNALASAISPQGETGETLVKLDVARIEAAVDHLATTLNYIKALK
jgi:hypothetical protein